MTVLVLGLTVPAANLSEPELANQIRAHWPNYVAYAFSFIVLGVYWIGHHNQFHYIKRSDRVFLWVNILFLLTIGFVPFSTSLLGLYPFSPTAVRVYGANLAATGLALYAVWWYATSQYRLVEKDLDPPHRKSRQEANYCWADSLNAWGRLLFSGHSDKSHSLPAPHSLLYPSKPH